LRDHAGVLPGAVAALRFYRVRLAGRIADRGIAARRGKTSRRRQSAGGYFGRSRHHADRSTAAEAVAAYPRDRHARHCAGHDGMNTAAPHTRAASAALIATDSASLDSVTISSTSSSRLIWATCPVSSPCSASVTTP